MLLTSDCAELEALLSITQNRKNRGSEFVNNQIAQKISYLVYCQNILHNTFRRLYLKFYEVTQPHEPMTMIKLSKQG